MTPRVTVEHVFGALDTVEIVVTLPTFRRPDHLIRTLDTLAAQTTSRPFAIVVMENDDERLEGREAARAWFERTGQTGIVIVAHERGNCSAYNAGWETALNHCPAMGHLLVIDDDELAIPEWIERMVAAAERLDVDFVGGPQQPVFEGENGARFARHPVFVPHYAVTGRVPLLFSSGNVVMRRKVLETMGAPFLDTAFNFIGGGDSDFYSRAKERGFTFGWCSEAPVMETTPARRTETSWIVARSLRNGAISAIIERRRGKGRTAFVKRQLKSAALLAVSPIRALKLGWHTRSAFIGIYHMQIAVGRFMAEFGQVNEQYRRPEQN